LFGGDNEIGNILQEAVKLKSAQMGQKRQTYEKWPFFVQHTLFHGEKDDFKAWRQLPFPDKMKIADGLKDEGNKLYASGSWSDAVDKYEEAASVVYYCYSTDPGWRKNNRGIDDDVIVLVDDAGSNEEEAKQQRKLRLACCLNLAACKQKLDKYDEAIVACNTALELDPDNVKGLYRRAEARVRPSKSTAYDHDLAIKDLAKAHAIDPSNTTVETLLKKLRGERKIQREKDSQTFTGMFDRGELYDKDMQSARPLTEAEQQMREIQQRIETISDEDSLEKRCEDAELLRDLYMRNGKEEEAQELNEKIKAAKKALKEPPEKPKMDWSNPTPEMIEDAKKYNLDLTDPLVIEELQRLESEGLADVPPEELEELEAAAGSEGGLGAPARAASGAARAAAAASSSPPAFDAPPADLDWGAPVPWARYIVLFFVMVVAWRLLDAGVLRWFASSSWRWMRRLPQTFGIGLLVEDDEERRSMFAAAYLRIVSILGGDSEDGEL